MRARSSDLIPNSGVWSAPDALGGIYGLSLTKNALFAVGDNDQILKKGGEVDWERLPATGLEDGTYEAPNYGHVVAFDDGTAYVSGTIKAKSKPRTDEDYAMFLEIKDPDELTEEENRLQEEKLLALYSDSLPYCPSSYKMAHVSGQAKRDFAHLFG